MIILKLKTISNNVKKEVKDWAADVGIVFTRAVLRLLLPCGEEQDGAGSGHWRSQCCSPGVLCAPPGTCLAVRALLGHAHPEFKHLLNEKC